MTKVALRAYNREIETLIDQGHTEEAVDHCMHILKTFPKHLETYRLMGKAYLEAHRYSEAADIFLRVLLAVPDDFVAHLGMSIVSDEKRDLNTAIWHMERAFEINSTNAGIQNELRRLYGRRDGVEPARIHLTRGALAQIYMKAGEYQQAIVEIKSVLEDDRTRNDMKTLLARAYFRSGMKNEAAEACMELLKLYPYNRDGNRILVEILPGTSLEQGLEQYQRRIRSLDPYAANAVGSVFETLTVSDESVMLDHLDWEPGQRTSQAFARAGSAQPGVELPTWMKQSGWSPSTGDAEAEATDFDQPAEPSQASVTLAAAEIPEWLKAMAPSAMDAEAPQVSAPDQNSQADVEADFDWLTGLGAPASTAPAETAAAPREGLHGGPVQPVQTHPEGLHAQTQSPEADSLNRATSEASADLDWLTDLTAEKPAAQSSTVELPDWLSDLGKPETGAGAAVESTPDWLKNLTFDAAPASQPAPLQDTPDWMKDLTNEAAPVEQTAPAEEAAGNATLEITPDWMKDMALEASADQEPVAEQNVPSSVVPEFVQSEDVPDWMKDLALETPDSEQSAPEAVEPAPVASDTSESAPDWMKDLALETPDPEPSVPEAVEPAPVASDTSESAPDWMKDLTFEAPAGSVAPPVETPESTPDWMQALSNEAPSAQAEIASEDMPDWMKALFGEPPAAPAEAVKESAPVDAWRDSLEAASYNLEAESGDETEQVDDLSGSPLDRLEAVSSLAAPSAGLLDEMPEDQAEAFKWLEKIMAGEVTAQAEPAQPAALAGEAAGTTETPAELSEPFLEAAPLDVEIPAPVEPAAVVAAVPAESVEEPPLSALVSGPGTSASEQDDALAWLESLAQKQGANPMELLTTPENRPESAPAWVTDAEAVVEPAPVELAAGFAAAPAGSVEEPALSALVSGPGTSASEQDDALAWLESLAQKQGANPDELLTAPESRLESAPAWVTDAEPVVEPAAAETPVEPAAAESAAVFADAPVDVLPPAAELEEDFAWLGALDQSQSHADQPVDIPAGQPSSESLEDLSWLGTLPEFQVDQSAQPALPSETGELDWLADTQSQRPVDQPAEASDEKGQELSWLGSLADFQAVPPAGQPANQPDMETQSVDLDRLAETQPTHVVRLGQDESQSWTDELVPGESQPEIAEPGAASAGIADAAAVGEDFDWLGDLSKPQEAQPQELPPARSFLADIELPDSPDVTMEWLAAPNRAAAKPVDVTQVEPELDENSDWFSSLDQSDANKTSLPMPWEEDTPSAQPLVSDLTPIPMDMEAEPEQPGLMENTLPESESVESAAWLTGMQTEDLPPQGDQPGAGTAPLSLEVGAMQSADDSGWLAGLTADEILEGYQPAAAPVSLEPAPSASLPAEAESSVELVEGAPQASEFDDTAAWLASLEVEDPEEAEVETPETPRAAASTPWQPADMNVEPAAEVPQVGTVSSDETLAWLASLEKEELPEESDEFAEEAPQATKPLPWEPAVVDALPWDQETTAQTAAAPEQPQTGSGDIAEWLHHLEDADKVEQDLDSFEKPEIWLSPISVPASAQESELEELPDWLKDPAIEEQAPGSALDVPSYQPEVREPAPEAALPVEPQDQTPVFSQDETPVLPPRVTAPLGSNKDALAVQQARDLLSHGGLNDAMKEYSRLIKRGKMLEEVIFDLQDAVYQHPVDVIVWQTLGDAFFRANRLQEALDAFGKAEGLLR